MRAYVLEGFGADPSLADVPPPAYGAGDVLVRVTATSVNPVDRMIGAGGFRAMQEHRFPVVLGRDVTGTVVAVGSEVRRFRPGDQVFGFVKRAYVGDGTFAELVAVPEDRFIVHRPACLPVPEAGALGLAGVTALQCLDALHLDEGASLMINGATGGVGAFAIQLAALRRLRVVATARPGAEEAHVLGLGAAEAVDWGEVPEWVDGLIDLVSQDSAAFTALADAALRPGGRAASTLSVAPQGFVNVHSDGDPALLRRVGESVGAGELRVPLVATYPLEDIETAFAALRAGPLGKIGLIVSSEEE